ncbi:hypothetical protein L1887_48857 [Cichorium endivia]|nr:hypothetical protein L1887_48857 [Cichorium endivia]
MHADALWGFEQARTASAKVVAGVAVMVAGTSIAKPRVQRRGTLELHQGKSPTHSIERETELERQIGSARRAVSSVTAETRGSGAIARRPMDLARAFPSRGEVKSLIPRHRTSYARPALRRSRHAGRKLSSPDTAPSLFRMLTPPLAAIIAVNTTNPQLAANLGAYYTQTERKYLPALTEQRQKWQHQAKELLNNTKDGLEKVKENTESSVRKGLESVESQTG